MSLPVLVEDTFDTQIKVITFRMFNERATVFGETLARVVTVNLADRSKRRANTETTEVIPVSPSDVWLVEETRFRVIKKRSNTVSKSRQYVEWRHC